MISVSIGAPAYFMSLFMVLVSVLAGFLSSSAFVFWLMMEFSVCSFCGVLAFTEHSGGESVAKYFVVNAFSGVGILSGMFGEWSGCVVGFDSLFLDFSLFMCVFTKLGLPPFHFWVVGALRECRWFSAFLLLGVQKVLPFVFFCYSFEFSTNLIFVVLLSAVSAGLAGLGHCEPYCLIGYSSMVVGNWLVLVSFVSVGVFLVCVVLYTMALLVALSCLRESRWEGGVPFQAPSNWEVVGVLILVVPVGPVYLMKILIWASLSGCGCLVGAWGVAFTSVLLVPLYMRIITLAVAKLWVQSVNHSYLSKWFLVPVGLSLSVFMVSGLCWGVDFWLWV